MHLVYHQAASGAWMKLKNYWEILGIFPEYLGSCRDLSPPDCFFILISIFEKLEVGLFYSVFIPKCSKQVNNKPLTYIWEIWDLFYHVLPPALCMYCKVSLCACRCWFNASSAWGGARSFHLGGSGLMAWQELGAGATGASLSLWPAVQSSAWPFAPGSSLSEKGWKRVDTCVWALFPCASGPERRSVCGRVCRVRYRQRSPPCPRALNQAPS